MVDSGGAQYLRPVSGIDRDQRLLCGTRSGQGKKHSKLNRILALGMVLGKPKPVPRHNWPFPSSLGPQFQSVFKCETIPMK